MTAWIIRKLRNHDPMSKRDKVQGKRQIEYAPGSVTAIHYITADGRVFEMSCREVNQEARVGKKAEIVA